MRLTRIAVLLCMSVLLNGCMTYITQNEYYDATHSNKFSSFSLCDIMKMNNSPIVYSGTIYNVKENILWPLITDCHGEGCMKILLYPLLLVGGLVDLPLCMVADTVILPYTIPFELSTDCKNEMAKPKSTYNLEEENTDSAQRTAKPKRGVPPKKASPMALPDN